MIAVVCGAVVVGTITGLYATERLFDWLAELGRRQE